MACCCKCRPKTRNITLFTTGIILLFIATVLTFIWPIVFKTILKSQLALQKDSKSYELWKETPIPMYLDIYMFNLTNSEEVALDWSIKPRFQETGPYVFKEKHTRVDVVWNDNHTVTFKQIRNWNFEPELSKGSLEDNITSLNVVAAVVGNMVKNQHIIIQKAVDLFMREEGETLFTKHTVRELLFEGYDDRLLRFIKNISLPGFNLPFTKFGWFVDREGNPDYDGVWTMNTGVDDFMKLGVVTDWNYSPNTTFYDGNCSIIQGTTGELWPPIDNNKTLSLFTSDMCSALTLDKHSTTEVKGIDCIQYTGQERTFDNGSIYPENECFVSPGVAKGLRDVGKCKFNAPAFVSFPHFYLADDSYRKDIEGMVPDKKKHELHLEIEPITGIPLSVEAKVQVNLHIEKISGIKMFNKAPSLYVPMFWFNQRALLSDELASQVKLLLMLPNFGTYTAYALGIVGSIIFLTSIILILNPNWKNGEAERLIDNKPEISS